MKRRYSRQANVVVRLLSQVALITTGVILSVTASLAPETKVDLLREMKVVVVDGVGETWLLQWDKPPMAVCAAEEGAVSLTCPCSGFAYGQQGELSLIRRRPGAKPEKLELGPFFIRRSPAEPE